MKKFCSILILALGLGLEARALSTYPFVMYLADQFGRPVTNTSVTISAWPPTNSITAVGTNFVLSTSSITFTSSVTGLISNNLAPGNYRAVVNGFAQGITFGIVSNNAVQNLAQVAGVPAPLFMNFTLAQFSDAGTMAYESTNTWTRNNYAGVTNALHFVPATNAGTLAYSQLPYTPATNSYPGLTNALGFVPATNAGTLAYSQLPYTPPTNSFAGLTNVLHYVPATNNPATNTIIYLSNVAGITNASGYVTNLTLTFTTNTFYYQQR